MKKFLSFAIAVILSASAFAAEKTMENKQVLATFNEQFAAATDVNWYASNEDNFVAKFTINSTKVTAHFDKNGALLATSRYITDADLPLNVMSRLIRKYADQKIHHVMEYVSNGSTSYVITLESAQNWTILKSDENGGFTQLRKLTKA
jgi:Cu/Ag efflux protein CusF